MDLSTQYIGYKIQIYPTAAQINDINRLFDVTRYVYNWSIDQENKQYDLDKGFIGKYDLKNLFTKYKRDVPWLRCVNSSILQGPIFDAISAYDKFFKGASNHPIFKSKKRARVGWQSLYIRADRTVIKDKTITVPGIGKIKCGTLPTDFVKGAGARYFYKDRYRHFYNVRLVYDGYRYWITLSMAIKDGAAISSVINNIKPCEKGIPIGIDIGCKKNNWIVDSNNVRVTQPDTRLPIKKIKHLSRRLTRQLSASKTKRIIDETYRSKNTLKTIGEINKYYKRMTNQRTAKIYDYIIHNIVAKNPEYVVIEDIHPSQMINKVYSRYGSGEYSKILRQGILNANIHKFQSILEYECFHNQIPLIRASSYYASSQRCSRCGSYHNPKSDSKYICPVCGLIADRDENAATNLKDYPNVCIKPFTIEF